MVLGFFCLLKEFFSLPLHLNMKQSTEIKKLLKTERGDEKRTKTPVDQELRGTFSFVHQATKVVH